MNDKPIRLIWIDLEMTGLNPLTDEILEIATIVTDAHLNILAEGPNLAIAHPESVLSKMDDWNTKQHTQSGLVKRVLESDISLQEAEQATLAFLKQWVQPKMSPMCGNTICQDRRFMSRLMPELEAYFHYRHLDVSTVKELARMWVPSVYQGLNKSGKHLALEDIKESIAELRYYRDTLFHIPSPENEAS